MLAHRLLLLDQSAAHIVGHELEHAAAADVRHGPLAASGLVEALRADAFELVARDLELQHGAAAGRLAEHGQRVAVGQTRLFGAHAVEVGRLVDVVGVERRLQLSAAKGRLQRAARLGRECVARESFEFLRTHAAAVVAEHDERPLAVLVDADVDELGLVALQIGGLRRQTVVDHLTPAPGHGPRAVLAEQRRVLAAVE